MTAEGRVGESLKCATFACSSHTRELTTFVVSSRFPITPVSLQLEHLLLLSNSQLPVGRVLFLEAHALETSHLGLSISFKP